MGSCVHVSSLHRDPIWLAPACAATVAVGSYMRLRCCIEKALLTWHPPLPLALRLSASFSTGFPEPWREGSDEVSQGLTLCTLSSCVAHPFEKIFRKVRGNGKVNRPKRRTCFMQKCPTYTNICKNHIHNYFHFNFSNVHHHFHSLQQSLGEMRDQVVRPLELPVVWITFTPPAFIWTGLVKPEELRLNIGWLSSPLWSSFHCAGR